MLQVLYYICSMASTFVIGKAALGYSPPIFLIGIRMTIRRTYYYLLLIRFFIKSVETKKRRFLVICQIVFFSYLSELYS